MTQHEVPQFIENDPRIGTPVRYEGQIGTILRVLHFSDGKEMFTLDLGKGHQVGSIGAQEIEYVNVS